MLKPQNISFHYDPSEAVCGGFLTPVYFNREVLTRYLYDSRFSCDFSSETYGTVFGPGFYISFGVNRNGTVFAWLGDLDKLPFREQLYWLVENKEPEGEIASQFFDAQIHAELTSPPAIIDCLNDLSKLNSEFHQKFGVHLYHDRSIEERIDETRRYKRLILNNQDDLKRFVSDLNEIINENTNNVEVRKYLKDHGIAFESGMKGNKLLQLVYQNTLGDESNLIAPFFYLYDLRLWADHSTGSKYLADVSEKLGVPSDSYSEILDALVAQLHLSIKAINERLNA
ncbi:hypothetical protein [Vreelandella stevensii]|uniref:hypothetical protein n=1 Tax=Vreelandella stevensii TaxID=502821 RepID=UPI00403AFB37